MMLTSRIANLRTTALAAALIALAPGAALAQQAPNAPQGQAQTDISDQELESFANAVVAVQQVRTSFEQQLQSTEGEQEKASVQEEAQAEMVNAIEGEGLSIQRYQTVAQAVQNDPALWEKVQEHLDQ